jgi:hypothetical protein
LEKNEKKKNPWNCGADQGYRRNKYIVVGITPHVRKSALFKL